MHAWYQEIAAKVLGDEVVIHHVDHASGHREDSRFYVCWCVSVGQLMSRGADHVMMKMRQEEEAEEGASSF
jgi:hypothetical protein